ncbi:hypothetical protein ONZ45_g17769 [Pleurotus djamor]|nr:hypothetical protein ONZ45_g17769 [Pleurotus djamor]
MQTSPSLILSPTPALFSSLLSHSQSLSHTLSLDDHGTANNFDPTINPPPSSYYAATLMILSFSVTSVSVYKSNIKMSSRRLSIIGSIGKYLRLSVTLGVFGIVVGSEGDNFVAVDNDEHEIECLLHCPP